MIRKHDAAVVSAYTGILMGRFDDFHKYIEDLMGRPVWTHEIPGLAHEIKERASDDWIELQSRLTEEEKNIIDNWCFKSTGKEDFVALADKWSLEPCPFCGGEATIRDYNGLYVECHNCHVRTPPFMLKHQNKAIEAWNTRPNPWHTGTPTELGWYLLCYPECKEQPYELAQWNGEHFVAVKPFHAIIVRIEASSVPYWQKIEENSK